MNRLSDVQSALERASGVGVAGSRIVRAKELHLRLERGGAVELARLLRTEFGAELALMIAVDRRSDTNAFEVTWLFAHERQDWFVHATEAVPHGDARIPSLATFHFPASRFEREIRDLFGIEPTDHPDLRPLVKHAFWPTDFHPLLKDAPAPPDFRDDGTPYPFHSVGGEGVYEIPVGPVHAGIIEPGHFRFSVLGETVIDMKSRLYFTHKGTEKLFEGRSPASGVELAERISGDTTVGHALAYCQAIEALADVEVPRSAKALRVVLLELERLYNHVADFGAIANDTGFAVAHAHCFRIRERLLRLNKRLTGNRLLRGGVVVGGVGCPRPDTFEVDRELTAALTDFEEIVAISLANTMLIDRIEGAGMLTNRTAVDHGVLGIVARASGIDVDARRDHPFALYGELTFRVPVRTSGDVAARTHLRVEEACESAALIRQALDRLDGGPLTSPVLALPPFEPAFGIVEGWRGAIIHWVMADEAGALWRVKVRDPSFVNWPALSFALLKNIVPDFPLCNKSFNQSYSGNDL